MIATVEGMLEQLLTPTDEEYDANCDGCNLSQGHSNVTGDVIHLPGNWILSQYQGLEGYLGWLALQPKYHRKELVELHGDELMVLGENVKNVELALRAYWREYFPNDEFQRMYIVYFYESVFDKPTPTAFHLHLHLIPRTKRIGGVLSTIGEVSSINAWNVYQAASKEHFPIEYRRDGLPYRNRIINMMNFIRDRLKKNQDE